MLAAPAGADLAYASIPVPQVRPAPPPPSDLLSAADGHAFVAAMKAHDRGRWGDILNLRRQITDPTALAILDWLRYQTPKTGVSLAEIVAFQERFPNWPRQDLLSRRAEEALGNAPMADEDIIAWFSTREPLTGEGKIRLGEALFARGSTTEGADWIQRAWVEHQFSRAREAEILRNYAAHLTLQAHQDRLNRLLWEQRFDDSRRMLQLVDAQARAVANARLKLAARARGADSAFANVPSQLRRDSGLVFDQARYLRRRGQDENAIPLLITAPTAPHTTSSLERWWTERKILARKALKEGQYQEAYSLAAGHGHKNGVAFADGEFLAGWIALQYLNNPNAAYQHFQTLENGVSTPISRSRGAYWLGRAAEALGRADEAQNHYKRAAEHGTTFYGQLALSRVSTGAKAQLHLPADPNARNANAALEAQEMFRAYQLLDDTGENTLARSFLIQLANTLTDAAQIAALADKMYEAGQPNYSVRVAKIAAGRNILLPERSYPTTALPNYAQVGRTVEPALIFGLSRQESEFDPRAVSHAGARGLMQLMPRTAREVARDINVPYRRSRLTDDPSYNAMLGAAHLGDLLGNFAGSYIMTIAAYNAGAHRVSQWVETYGDPRDPGIDPIDWIENIPFTETRNYVQRVMENIQVYRTRLAGNASDLKIDADIRRYDGSQPILRQPPKPQASLSPQSPALSSVQPFAVPTGPGIMSPVAPPAAAPANLDLPRQHPTRQASPHASPSEPLPVPAPVPTTHGTTRQDTSPDATLPAEPVQTPAAQVEESLDLPAAIDLNTQTVPATRTMRPVVDEDDRASRQARGLAVPSVNTAEQRIELVPPAGLDGLEQPRAPSTHNTAHDG